MAFLMQLIMTSAAFAFSSDTSTKKSIVIQDTIKKRSSFLHAGIAPYPSPKRAGLLSAIVPGLGQVYNKAYWKLPIVYGLLGAGTYFIVYNNKNYRQYKKAYLERIDGNPETIDEFVDLYKNENEILRRRDDFKKNLDMSVLVTILGVGLQVVDAITEAHLKDFDISPDISATFKPSFHNIPGGGNATNLGIGLTFALKLK